MAEYLDGFEHGTTSVEDIFYDLYGRAEAITKELDALRNGEPFSGAKDIPDTELKLDWGFSNEGGSANATTYVDTSLPTKHRANKNVHLLSTTKSCYGSGDVSRPLDVSAYRGQELSPDFSIHQPKDGQAILAHLGEGGLARAGRATGADLIGRFTIGHDKSLDKLTSLEHKTLNTIADGLVAAITVVEFIHAGKSALEVFEAAGRPFSLL